MLLSLEGSPGSYWQARDILDKLSTRRNLGIKALKRLAIAHEKLCDALDEATFQENDAAFLVIKSMQAVAEVHARSGTLSAHHDEPHFVRAFSTLFIEPAWFELESVIMETEDELKRIKELAEPGNATPLVLATYSMGLNQLNLLLARQKEILGQLEPTDLIKYRPLDRKTENTY